MPVIHLRHRLAVSKGVIYHRMAQAALFEFRIPDRRGHRLKPDTFALIIGGMKCGTTSLFELLIQHPQVSGSRVKEPAFFARDRSPGEWQEYLDVWGWDPAIHQVAVETSTAYAKHPWVAGVPERIAAAPGRFRFIYMVRDPVGRIQSQVRHGLYGGWGRSLDEELTEDLIDFSRYAAQLDRYAALFPRSDILVLTLEDLKRDPAGVLDRTCRFLGIDPNHQFRNPTEPRNAGDLYSAPSLITTLTRHPVLRWVADRTLPNHLRHRMRSRVARFGSHTEGLSGRWRLDESEIRHVRELLDEDMRRLQQHYGVDASWLPKPKGDMRDAE